MAKLMHAGKVRSVDQSDNTKMTKKLEEILAPMKNNDEPCFILIEGAPGIEKSVLLKESISVG